MNQLISIKEFFSQPQTLDTLLSMHGWIRSCRHSKAGISFIMLNDGSCMQSVQIVVNNTLSNYTEVLKLTKDCAIKVVGQVVKSLGKDQDFEIDAKTIDIVGIVENPETYPISPKKHTVEYLREFPHLRIRTNLFSAIARVRNTICRSIHNYFQNDGFLWVHTPIITTSDAEGAGELFRVTTFNVDKLPLEKGKFIDYKEDFFGKETFLTVSGQLNVEAYCMALSKVYTFGPTFRAEHSNTTRHLAEFWMVEPEVAFADLNDNAQLATNLLKNVFNEVLSNNHDDLEFLGNHAAINLFERLEFLVNNQFEMMTYTEAINHLLQSKKIFENQVKWGIDLSSEHERWLCEEFAAKPVIVTDYPKDIKAFYMKINSDTKTVAAMDILAPGIGEIVGGAVREDNYNLLLQRVRDMNIQEEHLKWYLDLRRFGSAPHAGFGLGLDRLVSYITGVANIRDVIPFPRASKFANF